MSQIVLLWQKARHEVVCGRAIENHSNTRTQHCNFKIATTDFPPNSSPSQLFGLPISDRIKIQIIEYTYQKFALFRKKYKISGNVTLNRRTSIV